MPKIVSEAEREQTKEAIYKATLTQIEQNGLRKVTVDDIVMTVGIGKGSFYSYYPSKEVCMYEVLCRHEKEMVTKLETALSQNDNSRERIEHILREVFLSGNILYKISPIDFEVLLRKLPPEYRAQKARRSNDYMKRSMELLKIDEEKMEALALLTDCFNLTASNTKFGAKGKEQAMNVLVAAIADFISDEAKK